jgi:hypothetical protein
MRLKWSSPRANSVPIHEKKRMLVPLGTPRQPSLPARVVLVVLRPPLLILGFIFSNMYKLCFGWLDRRLARQSEDRFSYDIRTHLSFLFTEHGAQIIPNEGTPFPPAFDGAYVTVAVGALRLRFVRGRGDFSVSVASEFAPHDWEDFRLVADDVGEWDTSQPRAGEYSLENFERILRPRLAGLQEALSKDRFEATLGRTVRTHNKSVEEQAARLRQSGITPIIIDPPRR